MTRIEEVAPTEPAADTGGILPPIFIFRTELRTVTVTCSRFCSPLLILSGVVVFLIGCSPRSEKDVAAEGKPPAIPAVGGEVPEDLVPLIDSLSAETPSDRAYAASQLRRLGPAAEPAVPQLVTSLSDPDWQVRWEAAEALGVTGNREAVEPLLAVLNDRDGEWAVRTAAARSLGLLGDSKAVEPLAAVLNDMNAHVRYAAVVALGRIGTEATREPLESAARMDSDGAVRFSASQALYEQDGRTKAPGSSGGK